ncbi:HPP family protein [Chitinophaga horti]|uniref:HPP family protein n=1 Tax=Chitinophaga horti TaxID=2920382 RepID=A0ABY6JAM0_9BACT|nr:HPP family protein [Chitinophaga horti]UYQ95321.1 HPP family protein [Chitinophaga horti]
MPVKRIKRSYRKVKYILYRETLIDTREHIVTFLGAFLGIGLIGFVHSKYLIAHENLFLIGSFGASSVLIYGVINSPLAQPRNLVGGHLISAIIGVICHKLFPTELWLGGAIAVALSIVAMQITKTLHPPGGATALIANMGTPRIESLGFLYVLCPVLTGVLILLAVALLVNNATKHRSYPTKPLFRRR